MRKMALIVASVLSTMSVSCGKADEKATASSQPAPPAVPQNTKAQPISSPSQLPNKAVTKNTIQLVVGLQSNRGEDFLWITSHTPGFLTNFKVTVNDKYVCKADMYSDEFNKGNEVKGLPPHPADEKEAGEGVIVELKHLRDAEGRSFGITNHRGIRKIKIETDQGVWEGGLSQ